MCPRSCNAGWRRHPTPTDILVRRGIHALLGLRHGRGFCIPYPTMRESLVDFYSEGSRVRGLWRTPEAGFDAPYPALIQGPGWLGLKDAKLYVRYHEAFTAAGFAVLVIDYRGFGDSEGDPGVILPDRQLEDLVNGVTYLTTRDDVDSSRIGVFGSGGTGGGNAVMLAAQDPRVRCAVAQVPVADGEAWLRGMRGEHEWYEFLARIDDDRVRRVVTGTGDSVHPRRDHGAQPGATHHQREGGRRSSGPRFGVPP